MESEPTQPGQSGDYVLLLHARNLIEAEFFKGLLVSQDVPAIIGDDASKVLGLGASAFGQGVPVLVPDEMLDEAREIIADHETSADTDEEDEDDADADEPNEPDESEPGGEPEEGTEN